MDIHRLTLTYSTLTFVGICGIAGLVTAADVPAIQLRAEKNIDALDSIADETHGALKWSNGAFLYMGIGPAPWFHTLDREGRLVSTATLNIPEASQFWGGGYDRGPDGSIVFAGGAYSVSGRGTPLIAWISPNGQTERVIRTAPYYVHMLSVAPDGTLWTIGCEMIDGKVDAPELDPNAGVLRHFDNTGKLIGSFFPQSKYVAQHQTIWLESGFLIAKSDRLGWYAPANANPGRYVEIRLDSMEATAYRGAPVLPKGAHVSQFALTDDGTASISVNEIYSPPPRNWLTYTFDRASSRWLLVPVTALAGTPRVEVLGSDANNLVIERGQGATFFSMPH